MSSNRKYTRVLSAGVVCVLVSIPALAGAERAQSEPPRAFMDVRLKERELYVNEAAPVQIKAYYRTDTGAAISQRPKLDSPAFTISALSDEPRETRETWRGVEYHVFTWEALLSPSKPGAQKLSAELPSTLRYQQLVRGAPERAAQSPFQDPFFDSFFDTPFGASGFGSSAMDAARAMFEEAMQNMNEVSIKEQTVTLKDKLEVTVVPLPEQGRPSGFSGAVGDFELAAEVSPAAVRVGEPVGLTLKVSGAGNFDRVTAPALAPTAHFKTYPSKAGFESEPGKAHVGTKTFEVPLVPVEPGTWPAPAAQFSFFNPETDRYETVSASPSGSIAVGASGAVSTIAPRVSGLAANAAQSGSFYGSYAPVTASPVFWAVQGIPALGFVGLAVSIWRKRRSSDTDRARRVELDRDLADARAEMARAESSGDVLAFFAAARRALQNALGRKLGREPGTVTLADLDALAEKRQELCSLFEVAEAHAYGGRAASSDFGSLLTHRLSELRVAVNTEIDKLKAEES